MMQLTCLSILDTLCPLHVVLDPAGHVVQTGPTLTKLDLSLTPGVSFLDVMDVVRPRQIETMSQFHEMAGRKLHLRQRHGARCQLKGVFVPDGEGGGVLDLTFGIFVQDAVRKFDLTSADFSPTDLSVELLYLIEANGAAMEASRRLNKRLQSAMFAAEERALTDTLTGLSNRRALDVAQSRLHRDGRDYSVMHVDLDYFKTVNDTLGHAAGDRVLRSVARAMLAEIRKDDLVARVGGDEFTILLGNTMTRRRLGDLAKRLIARIERPIDVDGETCRVSASIGIAQCHATEWLPEQVVHQADIALYAAKHAGRGQHRFYDAEYGENSNLPPIKLAGS